MDRKYIKIIIGVMAIGMLLMLAVGFLRITNSQRQGKAIYSVSIGNTQNEYYLTDTIVYTNHNTIQFKDMLGFSHEISVLNANVTKY